MSNSDNGFIRANFSLRGFAKCVNLDSLSDLTPDKQALVYFGRYLASLGLTADNATTFPSISDLRGVDYAGYVIEKERLDQSTGTWERIEEFQVIGSKANSYKDSRVAYGQTYRYRIRSVIKCTVFDSVSTNNQIATSLTELVTAKIRSMSLKILPAIAAASVPVLTPKTSTNLLPTFGFSSILKTTLNPTTGVANLTYSNNQQQINKLSGDIADINKALASSQPISDSVLESTISRLQQDGVTVPTPTKQYFSEYFYSYPIKKWQYVIITEDELPPAPETIVISPNSSNQNIAIYWSQPPDDQRDLASYKIYRRNALGDPWALIADNLPLGTVSFFDTNVSFGQTYIYALSSKDVHGYESFLSTQIQAQLNSKFQFEQTEKPLVWVSGAGARIDELTTIFKKFYPATETIIAQKNIKVSASKTYGGTADFLIMRIKSLDTHEIKDIPVVVKNIKKIVLS